MINSHQRNSAIGVLHASDRILLDHLAIKQHFVKFYEKIFQEEYLWRSKLDVLVLKSIDQPSV